MKHKVYSYSRWSSTAQRDGDSAGRQSAAAQAWLANNPDYELVESLVDAGVSAYTGKNFNEDSALGGFIAAVQAGKVPKGSVLLIDSWDRFSRQDHDTSHQQMAAILRAGIDVVVASTGQHLKKGGDAFNIAMAIVSLEQAHRESAEKGRKVRAARASAIERILNGEKRSPKDPSKTLIARTLERWLTWNSDTGDFELNHNAPAWRKCFELSVKGYGTGTICQMVNAEFAGQIHFVNKGIVYDAMNFSTVAQLLTNPTAYGRYTAKDCRFVDGYFPALVSKEVFETSLAASQARNLRKAGLRSPSNRKRNLTDKGQPTELNWLAGCLICGCCGGKVYLQHEMRAKDWRSIWYCYRRKTNPECTFPSLPRLTVERVCWEWLNDNHRLLDEAAHDNEAKKTAILEQLEKAQAELTEHTETLTEYPSRAMAKVVAEAQSKVESLQNELRTVNTSVQPLPATWDSESGRERLASIVLNSGVTFTIQPPTNNRDPDLVYKLAVFGCLPGKEPVRAFIVPPNDPNDEYLPTELGEVE